MGKKTKKERERRMCAVCNRAVANLESHQQSGKHVTNADRANMASRGLVPVLACITRRPERTDVRQAALAEAMVRLRALNDGLKFFGLNVEMARYSYTGAGWARRHAEITFTIYAEPWLVEILSARWLDYQRDIRRDDEIGQMPETAFYDMLKGVGGRTAVNPWRTA